MTVARARLSAEFCLGRIRLQAEELGSQQFPGNHIGPKRWLDLVNGLLDTAEGYLTASASSADETIRESATRDAARLGTAAYQCLNFMQGSAIGSFPSPVVRPFQRWLDDLGFKNTTFFRAETVANYEIYRYEEKDFTRIRDPSLSLQAAIAAITWPLIRITVPTKAFAILPHFAIVGHEIGHAVSEKTNWDLTAFQTVEKELIARIASHFGGTLTPQHASILNRIFINWFQELAADAYAALITGPAIFFSLCDLFQLLGNGYGLGFTHPANDLRRRAIFDEMTRTSVGGSFAQVFHKHTGENLIETINSGILIPTPQKAEIISDLIGKNYELPAAIMMAELHESAHHLVPIIYAQARAHLITIATAPIYTPAHLDTDLTQHLRPLLAAIPPIETGEIGKAAPASFTSILNVGWTTLLCKLGEFRVVQDGATHRERMETLHSLLEKAVELAEIKRLWEATK